ncbi:NAD(P)-binding protein [Venturia nashicola]|uniref:Short-chain dehydrogenase/reductase 3 n=1 Tax=Venturia nashicola TaxID=86259 RepID=A0A4Z1PJ58_9PEZI|nr:NAD(P)-binding protein [Venturia nashicola]
MAPSHESSQVNGFTFDTILSFIKHTALDPRKSLSVYLASLYTARGREIASKNPGLAKWLLRAVYAGIALRVKNFLDQGVSNNWVSDTYNWNKEIVVVTGGSDGIGMKVVMLLAERGVKVVVLDIQPPKYTAPPNVHYFHCDLANPDAIRATCAEVKSAVGNPTVLINNAGFARGKTILETTDNDLRLTFQINSMCHYQLAREFLPDMVVKNHGMVITVASLAAYATAPRLVDYAASKAAALAFHEGLQAEIATVFNAPKIRTVVVCQGYTKTALFEGFHKGDGFVEYPLDPETVAEVIVKAVLKGRSDHICLPRGNSLISGLAGWPIFMQASVRKDTKKKMKAWNGRQVLQPSELAKLAKEKAKLAGEKVKEAGEKVGDEAKEAAGSVKETAKVLEESAFEQVQAVTDSARRMEESAFEEVHVTAT